MLGVGIVSGGDIYVALLIYCLLLSIGLKIAAALGGSYGGRNWAVPQLRLLWPLVTLVFIVSVLVPGIVFAWLRPSVVLVQIAGVAMPVLGIGAVFIFLVTEPGQRRDMKLRDVCAVALISAMSIAVSAGLCALYFVAKYTFLIAVFLLALYSTRFNREETGAT